MEKQAFISYASEDAEKATSICKLLEQHNVHCWIAPRDITPGASYAEEIIKAIERTQALVLVMSENANNSPHVGLEVERAVSKAKTIFPVRIRECTPSKRLEYFVSGSQWIDAWASPLEMKVLQLANAIKALSETGRVTGTGEWKLGQERTFAQSEEPPTRNTDQAGGQETAEFGTGQRSAISPGVATGFIVGLCLVLGTLFYVTRPAPLTPPLRPISSSTPAAPIAEIRASSSSSFAVALNSSSSSQPLETALSLAIAKSLRDAEQKIFSSVPSEPNSFSSRSSSLSEILNSAPVQNGASSSKDSISTLVDQILDPALPLPVTAKTGLAPTPSISSESSQSSAVSVALVENKTQRKPAVKKPPVKPKEPVYRTIRSAKLAYKTGAITKLKYKEIVSKLEESYDTRVRQLKLDYRAGKITRDDYSRQVRALKERYYG